MRPAGRSQTWEAGQVQIRLARFAASAYKSEGKPGSQDRLSPFPSSPSSFLEKSQACDFRSSDKQVPPSHWPEAALIWSPVEGASVSTETRISRSFPVWAPAVPSALRGTLKKLILMTHTSRHGFNIHLVLIADYYQKKRCVGSSSLNSKLSSWVNICHHSVASISM